MMKKNIFLLALATLFWGALSAQSTDQTTLTITKEQQRLEATIICLDAIEAPTKYNEFAKPFITKSTFPKANNSHDELKKDINDWLVEHPSEVNKILAERKKAHDILYGPRPY
jgi:hypothetical protein